VDTAAPDPDDLILTERGEQSAAALDAPLQPLPVSPEFLQNLWEKAGAEAYGLTLDEFISVLTTFGKKHNYGLPLITQINRNQIEAFLVALHLPELALAHACALGREAAWEQFLRLYGPFIKQTAVAITGSPSLGHDLADSLYAELYGLRESAGARQSPLASYSGRGSLQGWLRTTLVQRSRDHYRRTHRETPLGESDFPRAESLLPNAIPSAQLSLALAKTLFELSPEDRFLLSAHFLDRQTLLQIARTLNVHEATVSRRLTRLLNRVRQHLIANLQQNGFSRRAAEEALETDPRDLEINLRALLQSSQLAPFPNTEENEGQPDTP
jgi:RNA polymerase sigma-70 factor, ECF subfamily